MSRKYLLPVAVLIILLSAVSALAKECNAIPWGEPFQAAEQLTFVRSGEGIKYYAVTKLEACGLYALEDTRVTYGFLDGKLYTTIIEIDKAKDLKKIVSTLMDSYGLPDYKKDQGWDIYKWETDTLKIKLKSQYSTDRTKIGMYYKPLIPQE